MPLTETASASLPALAKYVELTPPATLTLALPEQLVSVTVSGDTARSGAAVVPGAFTAVAVAVWPDESVTTKVVPGAGEQVPLVPRGERAAATGNDCGLDREGGGARGHVVRRDAATIVKSALTLLAHCPCSAPAKAAELGITLKPGLLPVDCAIVKLVRWKVRCRDP